MFPIKSINKNELINTQDLKSYCYRCNFLDIEQMDGFELDGFVASLLGFFNSVDPIIESIDDKKGLILGRFFKSHKKAHFYKFFLFDGKLYINSTLKEDSLFRAEFIKEDKLLDKLFLMDDLYSNVLFFDDYFKINGTFFRLINFYDLPPTLSLGEFSDVGDLIIQARKLKDSEAQNSLELKRRMHHANNNQELDDLRSSNAKEQSESLLESLILKEESLFKLECWVRLKSSSLEELDKLTKKTVDALKELEVTPLIEDVSLSELFKNTLPGVEPKFFRGQVVPTSYFVNAIPTKRDFWHKKGSKFYSKRDREIYFDLFEESAHNYNMVVSGLSGTGKSVFAEKIVSDLLKKDIKAVILDRGGSFKKLALYHEGRVFENSFNPMQFNSPEYLKEFIVSAIPESELSIKERGKLLKLIKEILKEEKKITFTQLLDQLESEFRDIKFYFEEMLDCFSDDIQKVSKITYIDLENYPERVLSPLIIFLIEYFKNLEGKRVFLFDESWYLLERNRSYIGECFRTFRKMGASAIAITQMFSDFVNTPIGVAMAQNSFYKVFFRHQCKTGEFLEQFDLDKINSLKTHKGEYSEFYIKSPFNKKVMRYFQSNLEYELFTTDFLDNRSFNSFLEDHKKYLSFREIIHKWVEVKYA